MFPVTFFFFFMCKSKMNTKIGLWKPAYSLSPLHHLHCSVEKYACSCFDSSMAGGWSCKLNLYF